jgi:hypothetical protein
LKFLAGVFTMKMVRIFLNYYYYYYRICYHSWMLICVILIIIISRNMTKNYAIVPACTLLSWQHAGTPENNTQCYVLQSEGRVPVHLFEVGYRLEFKSQWQSVESDPNGHVHKNLYVSELTCFMLPFSAECSKRPARVHMDFSLSPY